MKMENLSHPLVIAFIISWIIEFYLFGMQRASLLISRQNNVEWRGIGEQLLPDWYRLTWIVIIANYVLLVAILIVINWKLAIGLLVISFILSTIIPIPFRPLYKKTFRKKVEKIKSTNHEAGQFFSKMLDNTGF
jgi:ABC-type multidrug transport system fused ATPase/permease subunit